MALVLSERERERQKHRESVLQLASGQNSVCKEILGITRGGKKILIYQWGLHNLSSQRHCQLRVRIQLVAVKSKVHVISVKTLRHRDGTLSCCFSEQCCTTRLAVILPILQWGGKNLQDHTLQCCTFILFRGKVNRCAWNLSMNTIPETTKLSLFPFYPCRVNVACRIQCQSSSKDLRKTNVKTGFRGGYCGVYWGNRKQCFSASGGQ